MLRAEDRLVELHGPFRPDQRLIQIATGRQHRFQLANTQREPAVVFAGRQPQQFTHAGEVIMTFFIQLFDQRQIPRLPLLPAGQQRFTQ